MKWLNAAPILICLVLTACSTADTADYTTALESSNSANTGSTPTHRAKAVKLAASPAKPSAQPPPTAFATTAPAPQPPPADASPAPAPEPPSAITTSLPTPAPQPASSAPVETTPESPAAPPATTRALSASEARVEVVVLETSMGNIVIELNDVEAPRTCGNFRKLVRSGFYNHTLFHRVIPHFMIQGGDPNTRNDDRRTYGLGDPGYTLPAEIKLNNVAGAVAMARLPDASNPQRQSNGSQFYICVADAPSLDGKYTVFGRVIRGMNVVNKIASAPRDKNDDPLDRIEIQASLETKQQALEENPR